MNTLIGRDWSRYPGATISGGPFDASTPASNLLSLQPQGGVIANGGASFTLQLPAALSIGIVHLQNLVNVTSASISVGGYSANRSAPPPGYGDDEFAALGRALFFILPAPVVASSVNFTVSGGSPMIIGSAGACEAFEPPFDIATGPTDTVQDLSDVETITFGSTYVVVRPTRRIKDCAIPYLPDATQPLGGVAPQADYAAAAFRIALICGKHLPMVIVPFPDDDANIERKAIWGLSKTDQQFSNQFFGFYSTTFQVTQLV